MDLIEVTISLDFTIDSILGKFYFFFLCPKEAMHEHLVHGGLTEKRKMINMLALS